MKNPRYTAPGETTGLMCAVHGEENEMVCVTNTTRPCDHPGCGKVPSFNVEGSTHPIRCKKHKDDIMVNVKSPTCAFHGCPSVNPKFNEEGEPRGKWCVDMQNKTRCAFAGCKEMRPRYNAPGEKTGLFCKDHAGSMIDVYAKRCAHPPCMFIASFNVRGQPAEWCMVHKTSVMRNVTCAECTYDGEEGCDVVPHYNLPGKKGPLCGA